MHIEIVSIGDELLKGMIVNTNAAFLGHALFENGYEVSRQTVFSDDPPILDKELRAALSRSPVIIATGGLGSTLDDHTRTIATALFGSEFSSPLVNAVGTATGLVFSSSHKMLILLPGIPLEMQTMFHTHVLPLLHKHMPVKEKRACAQMHLMLSESVVDSTLRELQARFPEVQVGIYPSYGMTSILLASLQADQLCAFKEALVQQFSSYIFSYESCKIEEAVHMWFIHHRKRLALAESCTGGEIASKLVSVPDASQYFLGSFVTYSDAFKTHLLGVSEHTLKTHGAVSEPCVKEMLLGVFRNSDADYAIAVSGIAGPTGGSEKHPVGTVFAAIGERGQEPDVAHFRILGPRTKVIQAATNYCLGALWRKVAKQNI